MIRAAEVYTMLGNANLWETAQACHQALEKAGVPHAVAGGVAVCLHGYQRNTVDLDILVRRDDAETIRRTLEDAGLIWDQDQKEFRTQGGIAVQCLLGGDRAGTGSEVKLPDPGDDESITTLEGLPVVSLARLIETKLACGEGDPRRTHKDFADVVELIARHNLSRSFARHLHKSLRKTFRQLVLNARGEQSR